MRPFAGLLLAGLALVSGMGQAAARPVAFVGATVIDGTGRAPVRDAVLLVEEGRIVGLGPRGEVGIPDDAERIDVRGRWIVPGLVDAHVHFFQSGGLYTRPDIIDLREIRSYQAEIATIREQLPATLARYVASGVTSVVDVGGPDWSVAVRALANELEVAPRVAVAGPLLGTHAPPELRTDQPPIIEIETPAEARAAVRRQLELGIDLIKIWFVFPEADLAADLAWVQAAVDEAHAAGVRVVAHATEQRVARAVIQAGIDILAHSIGDEPIDQATLALMREQGVIYTPTLMVGRRYRAVFGRHLELTDIERRLGDPEAIASFGDLDRRPPEVLPSWLGRAQPRPLDPVAAHNLRRVHAARITVAAGSDAGNIGTLHGPSLHRELELMVQAGLTPMQVLVAATAGGAAVMGRDDLGALAPGKLADFVILDADPLADIRHTRRIWCVVKGGEILDPADVIGRLSKIESRRGLEQWRRSAIGPGCFRPSARSREHGGRPRPSCSGMRCDLFSDEAGFLDVAARFLGENEAENTVVVGCALHCVHRPRGDAVMAVVHDDHAMRLVAIMTPPRALVLSAGDPEAIPYLVETMRGAEVRPPGVFGLEPMAERFAALWRDGGHPAAEPGTQTILYRANLIAPPGNVPGELRTAAAHDIDWLAAWQLRFAEQAGLSAAERAAAMRAVVSPRVTRGEMVYWAVEGRPVASAAFVPTTPASDAGRINAVFTLEEEHGKGYGSACVAALSRRLLDRGWRYCLTFADRDNPTATRMHPRLGYQEIATFATIGFCCDG